MMSRLMVTFKMVVAIVSLLLLGAVPAMADQHEVECFECHTDGTQGVAG